MGPPQPTTGDSGDSSTICFDFNVKQTCQRPLVSKYQLCLVKNSELDPGRPGTCFVLEDYIKGNLSSSFQVEVHEVWKRSCTGKLKGIGCVHYGTWNNQSELWGWDELYGLGFPTFSTLGIIYPNG